MPREIVADALGELLQVGKGTDFVFGKGLAIGKNRIAHGRGYVNGVDDFAWDTGYCHYCDVHPIVTTIDSFGYIMGFFLGVVAPINPCRINVFKNPFLFLTINLGLPNPRPPLHSSPIPVFYLPVWSKNFSSLAVSEKHKYFNADE